MFHMLVSAHCERNQWEQAEKLVVKHTDAQIKDKMLGRLTMCYSKGLQWNMAKNILLKHTSFKDRDKILKLVASACYQHGEFGVAKMLLLEHVKDKTEEDVQGLESSHMLADLYLQNGELELAVTFGKLALEGRSKALGRQHKLFFESVLLIVEIYIAKGDIVEADGYTALLPSSHKNLSKLRGELLQESSDSRPLRP